MLWNMKVRAGSFTWLAAKHASVAHAARGVVPGRSIVTAVCGVQLRPSPWPFVLPGPCPDCERVICEREVVT